ncbi:MAG: hypothetical protein B7Z23_02850, partial [Pseudomonadales bacterium 32-61-5]
TGLVLGLVSPSLFALALPVLVVPTLVVLIFSALLVYLATRKGVEPAGIELPSRIFSVNDAVMVFAFAPIVALLLGVSSIPVPWDTLLLSVVMYIVIPLAIAQFIRKRLLRQGEAALQTLLARIGPFSIVALLATLVLLFSFQGQTIVAQPLIIAMLAVPILLQTLCIAALGYWMCRKLKVRHDIAGPAAMIGASNFFELAVAVAIVLYGFNSGAALATVVGVLIEVPVMLWLVKMINNSSAWYERGLAHH